jgi:predicted dehydrogenase
VAIHHKVYRAGILGCGRIGCFLDDDPKRRGIWTHAGAYAPCPRTELSALADWDADARRLAGHRWNVERVYPDLESMLQAERLDILSVCTPSGSHASAVLAAAAAGVPAVWCEKPMAVSVREAETLLELPKTCIVAINHTRRWDRAYETAREWLKAGNAGRLRAACAWYAGGVSNIGSHLFDTLRFLLGDAEWVWANANYFQERDPTASGVVAFSDGLLCHVIGCRGDLLLFEIDLLGDKGRLSISNNGARVESWATEPSSRYSGYDELKTNQVLWEGDDERRMLTELEEIVRCLDDSQMKPRCDVSDGLKAVELVTAFLYSAQTGKRITLPLAAGERGFSIPVR